MTYQWLLAHAGRIAQAIGELRRLTAANPNDMSAAFVRGSVLLHADRNAEAAEVLGALVRATRRLPVSLAFLCLASCRIGEPELGQRLLTEIEAIAERGYVQPMSRAVAHVGLGDIDAVFCWLEQAITHRDSPIIYVGLEPVFDPLRSDFRFTGIVQAIGLSAPHTEANSGRGRFG